MSAPQNRIQQLIELATKAPADDAEARNAAVLACRLIRQHGLLIVRPEELISIQTPPAPQVQSVITPVRPPRTNTRRRKPKEAISETAETIATSIDGAAQVAGSVLAFTDLFRRR